MPPIIDAVKRVLVGRPYRSDRLSETLMRKRIALPVFASDALSSVAYAPDEILLTLSIAGLAAMTLSPWVGAAVIVVLLTVVASYRQNVYAYPNGGGGYEIANANLGTKAGLTVASSLVVDYVLTVAVSMSSAASYAVTAVEFLHGHQTALAIGGIVVLMLLNLRGVKEAGWLFALPTYVFIFSVLGMIATGLVQLATGTLAPSETANYDLVAEKSYEAGLVGIAGGLLVLRAFSSGAAALTGVEAISNGVPTFRPPKSRNASTTLLMLGMIAAAMIFGILTLSQATGVKVAENPTEQLSLNGVPVTDSFIQHPVLSQLAAAVFSSSSPFFFVVVVAAGLILLLASNTAFNGLPVLASILAKDGFLPRQLRTRGDRLTFSNSIIALAVAAIALVWAYDATVTELIHLYIVGVFISFTLSQLGMVKHWNKVLNTTTDPAQRRRIHRSRAINALGFGMTGTVLVIVLITKFTRGAWIALLAMAVLYVFMWTIHRHYEAVAEELAVDDSPALRALPSRVHAIVLVSHVRKHTLRALAYARASRPSTLEAVIVDLDEEETRRTLADWERLRIPVPLTVVASPYRETTKPIVDYISDLRRDAPRDLVVVYLPEYVVGKWWEQLVHNQTALRIKSRLHFMSGVMVTSVPWQLNSSEFAKEIQEIT